MLAYGYIKSNWQQAVDLYTRQCSIGVNARDLATMAATLAVGRQESGQRQTGHRRGKGPERPRRDGDGRPVRRLRESGSITPGFLPRAASAAASSPCRPASSASRSCRRPSTTRETASARSAQSTPFRRRSMATRMAVTTTARAARGSQNRAFEIYGFAMLDIGQDFKQINPNWFDTMRVTKLPSFEDQFGTRRAAPSPACGRAASA